MTFFIIFGSVLVIGAKITNCAQETHVPHKFIRSDPLFRPSSQPRAHRGIAGKGTPALPDPTTHRTHRDAPLPPGRRIGITAG